MSEAKKYSKYVGVTFDKRRGLWMGVIKIQGRTKFLGYFKNEHDAYLARCDFEEKNQSILFKNVFKKYTDAVCDDYISGNSIQELAIKYNKDVTSIRHIIVTRNILRPHKSVINESNSQKILDDYISGVSILKISEDTDISVSSLMLFLKKNNINCRNSRKFIMTVDNFLECIDAPWKAYFLGLFYADGNMRIVRKKSFNCSITLAEQDSYILNKLYDMIYKNNDFLKNKMLTPKIKKPIINVKTGKCYNLQNAVTLMINSKELYNSLELMGCTPRKSLILKFPTIPKEYMRDFIRGYIDGDGWVVNKSSVGIISSKEFCEQYSAMMANIFDESPKLYNAGKVWRAIFHKQHIFKQIYEWLYTDCDGIFIPRKHERFLSRIHQLS